MTAIYAEIIKSARPIPYFNSEKGVLIITILLSKTANRNTSIVLFCCLVETWSFEIFLLSETPFMKNKRKKKKYSVHKLRIKGLKRKKTKKCNTFVFSPFSTGEQLKLGLFVK